MITKQELYAWARTSPAPNAALSKMIADEMVPFLKSMRLGRPTKFWENEKFLSVFPLFERLTAFQAKYSEEDIASIRAQAKSMGTSSTLVANYNDLLKSFRRVWKEIYPAKVRKAPKAEK